MCIILATSASLIIHTQACSCMHMILPRNLNLILSISASYFICNAFVLDLSLYVYGFKLLFHMFDCPFFLHVRIRVYPSFLHFNSMNTHSHDHT